MWKGIVFLLLMPACFWVAFANTAHAENICFQCHDAKKFAGAIVHQPVSDFKCGICHNPHVARFKGLLNIREDRLCYSCHVELEREFQQGVVHEPVTRGECSTCHAPHVSNSKGLVRDNLADDCFTCHEKMPREYSRTHKPFAQGQCTACHKPHRADNQNLLADDPDTLCFSCHEQDVLQKGHRNYPGSLRDCLSCHNPHGSERAALVRNILHKPFEQGCADCHDKPSGSGMAACLNCHENIQKQVLATRSHLTLHDGNSCLNCHSPHTGDTPALLKSGERQICTPCHDDTLAIYAASKYKHPDIKKCSVCHDSHGSSHLSMLKGNGNDVCVECHKTQGNFSHPVGPEVLDSHTGQMVTCISCHKPMGTDYQYHLVQDGEKALCIQCHWSY